MEDWRKEEEVREAVHQEKLRTVLQGKLSLLEDNLAIHVDPTTAVTTVFNLETVRFQLEQPTIKVDLSPDQHLVILDRTEEWYKSRSYKYPFPERLKEQRAHWQKRIAENENKS